ncbi:MAG: DUF2274 domain-containing protein [Rhizobiaceae bacterium]
MAPLKLAKLPDREMTKITFAANAGLIALLNEYATAYEREYGRKEAVTDLIPPMLEAFIRSDRGFRNERKQHGAAPSESKSQMDVR